MYIPRIWDTSIDKRYNTIYIIYTTTPHQLTMELGGSDAAVVALFEMREKDAAGIESGTAARAVEALRRGWMGQAMDQLRVRQTLRDGRLTRMSWRLRTERVWNCLSHGVQAYMAALPGPVGCAQEIGVDGAIFSRLGRDAMPTRGEAAFAAFASPPLDLPSHLHATSHLLDPTSTQFHIYPTYSQSRVQATIGSMGPLAYESFDVFRRDGVQVKDHERRETPSTLAATSATAATASTARRKSPSGSRTARSRAGRAASSTGFMREGLDVRRVNTFKAAQLNHLIIKYIDIDTVD
jgi:hypothetical protein